MWLREIFSDIKILWRSCADQQCSRNLHLCHWVPQMSKILLHQCLRKWVLPYFNTLPHDSVYIFHPLLRDPFPYLLMHYWYAKITPWFQGSLAMQIHIHKSIIILYQNMNTLDMVCDIVWTHETFHGRRQEESVILKSIDGQSYVKVHLFFKVSISNTTYDITFIQDYSAVPSSMLSEDDGNTGFHCLMLEGLLTSMKLISPEDFVCAAFIVKMDDNCINCYLLNNLVDNDMYFQLGQ